MNESNELQAPAAAPTALSRRDLLCAAGLAALAPLVSMRSLGQSAGSEASNSASQLPLKTTGLEHLGTVVPDVAEAGKFYGRLFNPELYKEKDPPLRYYVTLGVGYLALGSRANQSHAFFDHFCALVENYDARAMAEQLQREGLPAGRYGIIPDPDGIGLQLLGVPGGLAKTTEPAGRIVEADALVQPEHLDHVVLRVSELEKSLQFYRRFFGSETRFAGPGPSVGFQLAGTRLLLEQAASGEPARIGRIGIDVRPFDRRAVSRQLTQSGAQVSTEVKKSLRFTDPFGLVIELQPT
jgi:catechol 2,3-dioxygenase-like lactoylglutathione lyase family enzyme